MPPRNAPLAVHLGALLVRPGRGVRQAGRGTPLDWLWLALLGVFCTGLAHSLFVASLRVLKARTAAVTFALEPVYGIFFAWLLFSETPSLGILAGGALIVLATFVSARLGR